MPRFLVTAGNTREMIDRVRDWGNIFTGNTGYSIARALSDVGDVDLLTSNAAHLDELRREPRRITGHAFTSHASLQAALAKLIREQSYEGVFMTAAVADYVPAGVYEVVERRREGDGEVWRVRDVSAGKVKSTFESIAVLGTRTRKLVDLFRTEWGYRGLLVKFKLEVGVAPDPLVRTGQASRASSGADYLVANTLDMVGGPAAGAYLLGEDSEEWVVRDELPGRLARIAEEWVRSHPPASNAGPFRA